MRHTRVMLLLATAVVVCTTLSSAHAASVLADWQYNDREPGQSVWNAMRLVDSSGTGRDGWFSQVSTFVPGAPEYGSTSAIHFTAGSDQGVFRDGYDGWRNEDGTPADGPDAGPDINFAADESFTVEALIKTTQSGTGAIVSKDKSGYAEWWWIVRDGVLQAYVDDGPTGGKAIGSTSVIDGEWHHIAMVRDAATDQLRLYVDHVLDASVTDPTTGDITNYVDIRIGRMNSGYNDLVGDIDFVRISSGALAPYEFIQPVPEPSSVALLCSIFGGLLIWSRRK